MIFPRHTPYTLGAGIYEADRKPKNYESFIAQDWKNKKIVEISCAPSALASYFDEGSPLPFQTSPVFFKPEVLDRYKADPDKYRLEDRTISCRNSWCLQTYDVNAAGQVHTLITYLGDLPHAEQIYWRSFNEPPKSPISSRSLKTDFEGAFDDEEDGLRDLKSTIEKLHQAQGPWFTLQEPKLVEQLHYPLTTSNKMWGDALTTLAKCVTESLSKSYFESMAKGRGSNGDPAWGSIRWAREFLSVSKVDPDRINEILGPLVELQRLRSKLSAHAGGTEAATIRRELLKTHKTPRAHIQVLAAKLTNALLAIDGKRPAKSSCWLKLKGEGWCPLNG